MLYALSYGCILLRPYAKNISKVCICLDKLFPIIYYRRSSNLYHRVSYHLPATRLEVPDGILVVETSCQADSWGKPERTRKLSFVGPKNVVRQFFAFGSGKNNFSNQNEKKLARKFSKTRTIISALWVRKIFLAKIFRKKQGKPHHLSCYGNPCRHGVLHRFSCQPLPSIPMEAIRRVCKFEPDTLFLFSLRNYFRTAI
nr:hypothetical protein [Porphyromonas gingivalis]